MKFFGWGRKKDPPPLQPPQQACKPDSKKDGGLVADGLAFLPGGGSPLSSGIHREGNIWHRAPPPPAIFEKCRLQRVSEELSEDRAVFTGDEEVLSGTEHGAENWEDRLQETIRFVFSHEQEGLLAIGTFALDQLAGVRDAFDGCQTLPPPATDAGFGSSRRSASGCHDFRSSDDDELDDDEHRWCRLRWVPSCGGHGASGGKTSELPVFGDHDINSGDSDAIPAPCGQLSWPGGVKLQGTVVEMRGQLDTSTNQRAKQVHPLAEVATEEDAFSDGKNYSTGVCGLLASKKRSSKGERSKRNRRSEKKLESEAGSDMAASKGGALGRIGRLLRPSFNTSSAKVVPEKRTPSSPTGTQTMNGPPCIANRTDSGGEEGKINGQPGGTYPPGSLIFTDGSLQNSVDMKTKVAKETWASDDAKKRDNPSTGWDRDQHGKWINDDSEFVVLEM